MGNPKQNVDSNASSATKQPSSTSSEQSVTLLRSLLEHPILTRLSALLRDLQRSISSLEHELSAPSPGPLESRLSEYLQSQNRLPPSLLQSALLQLASETSFQALEPKGISPHQSRTSSVQPSVPTSTPEKNGVSEPRLAHLEKSKG